MVSRLSLRLTLLPETCAVCQLASDAPLPAWALTGAFYSLTRTARELSVVCPEACVPEGVQAERGWRCFRVVGPLDFALTGVLAALVGPLAAAGISIFALSTYETDYLFVKAEVVERVVEVLREVGHKMM